MSAAALEECFRIAKSVKECRGDSTKFSGDELFALVAQNYDIRRHRREPKMGVEMNFWSIFREMVRERDPERLDLAKTYIQHFTSALAKMKVEDPGPFYCAQAAKWHREDKVG